jgi:hypothetical protein
LMALLMRLDSVPITAHRREHRKTPSTR